ncbi:MAG: caspase family protein [Propylenella sp.]
MRSGRLAAALLFAGAAIAPAQALAAVHALVVGINDYVGPPKLMGAVNDAHDVSTALKLNGVEVRLLTDRQATRENVFAEWQSMVDRSQPGDLLIFHFAGHGINEDDASGDEEDGQDETYLLADYDDVNNPGERLVDDELDVWLTLATGAGRKVLFVADACHSGSPTRSIFGESLPTRFYVPRTKPERPRPMMVASVPQESRESIFSVGATLDSRTVPEIMIEDAPRGALSYAVARAFEGKADLDRNGTVVAAEFEAFVEQNVRSFASSKQTPQFEIPDEGFPIIAGRQIEVIPAAPEGGPIRIHIRDGAAEDFRAAIAGMEGVELIDDEPLAQLIFDPTTGTLANNAHDPVAQNLDLDGLKVAIEADRALKELMQLGLQGTLTIAHSPDDGVHPEGAKIGFTVPSVGGSYLTIFDLTATGSIHFLWPTQPGDIDPYTAGESFTLDTMVTPPFGADNLVVLATDSPPVELRAVLKQLDGTRDPAALIASLKAAVADQPYRIALQAFFTGQK